jgi:tRNA-2-methylthio-N6-dimethylallyladenosine synthase
MALSTDLIVGFPGETEDDFQETLQLVRDVAYDQVYAFAYSPRPGTTATTAADAVTSEVKAERLQRLFRLTETIQMARNATLVGRTVEVLIDGTSRMDAEVIKGRTRCNRIVHLPTSEASASLFLQARITRAHAHSLTGTTSREPSAA